MAEPRQSWEYGVPGYVFMARDNSSLMQIRFDVRTGCWEIYTLVRYKCEAIPSPWPPNWREL